ncbi:unnamed protein product [Cylicocyclus nassatus]|uniref:Uncharacterized protein n=1 Tax=Cylicocyclus nassatus TaxID=53992 RepID=A0AA36M8A2_CYLNA|nr:unnamed protein product [Cylicocyclus nassatus]
MPKATPCFDSAQCRKRRKDEYGTIRHTRHSTSYRKRRRRTDDDFTGGSSSSDEFISLHTPLPPSQLSPSILRASWKNNISLLWANESVNFFAEKAFNQSAARSWLHCAVCQMEPEKQRMSTKPLI